MATLMTLPQELRDRIYGFIALEFPTRHIQTIYTEDAPYPTYKVKTSATTATCRKVHKDYQEAARKATTALQLTALNMDFNDVTTYFDREIDSKCLAILQLNKAKIHIKILLPDVKARIQNNTSYTLDMENFYPWALCLIKTKLEVEYHSDLETLYLFDQLVEGVKDRCVVQDDSGWNHSSRVVQEKIEEIRRQAEILDGAIWEHYRDFYHDLQIMRRRRLGLTGIPRG